MGSKNRCIRKLLRVAFCLVLSGVIALAICSCSSSPCSKYLTDQPIKKPKPLKKPIKPISILKRRQYDLCLLQSHGVQVIRLGQTWRFVFPSDDLFDNDTPEINARYQPLLNIAADFMKTYPKIAVKIEGFSNRIPEEWVTKTGTYSYELTQLQADEVARYLTECHINARFIYAVGKGGLRPVAWNDSAAGRHLNRRLEISFRYYRDNTAWY